jgi:hypothetical protein
VRELGEEVDEQDLVALGEHQCYARISAGGERLPTFSLRLDPPPASDPDLADRLAAASVARYGRAAALVEHDLRLALSRIESSHRTTLANSQAGRAGMGIAKGTAISDERVSRGSTAKARNEHRRQKSRRSEAHQATLFEAASDEPAAGPASTMHREGDEPGGEEEPVP